MVTAFLQFRASCFFNGRRFYSTENSVQNSHLGNVGSVSFIEIARSPNFVDKTLFIQKVLECGSKHLLITAPRLFGKSINLDMLRCFLADRNYYDVFSRLKIGGTSTMNYCGQFPVLWLNFKTPSPVESYEDAVVSCRLVIHEAFRKNKYLCTSSRLDDKSKNYCEIWCDSFRYKSFDQTDVSCGLRRLAECLYRHNGKKSILLVDEYDAICSAAFTHVNAETLSSIIDFQAGIVGSVIKDDPCCIDRSVIIGFLRVMCAELSGPMNNVVDYPFTEEANFVDCYGVTEEEFTELLNRKCNSSVAHLKNEAISFYNGYQWKGTKILNTWSVMNFLEKKNLRSYWVESGVPDLRIHNVCKNYEIRKVVKNLIEDDTMDTAARTFNARNFHSFLQDFRDTEDKMLASLHPLLYYYTQQGYLTIVERLNNSVRVRIPNTEVRNLFVEGLVDFFRELHFINRSMLDNCADIFRKINLTDETECKNSLRHIGEILAAMCNRGDYIRSNLINEALLEDLMSVIMYLSDFQPITHTVVRQIDNTYTKLDLCSYRNSNRGAVIEFKVNESAEVALDSIFEKGYARELFREWKLPFLRLPLSHFSEKKSKHSREVFIEDTLRKFLPENHNFLLLGINLDKRKGKCGKHVLTIRYLRNSFRKEDEVEIVII